MSNSLLFIFISLSFVFLKKKDWLKSFSSILKERSPSCGSINIYDGTFSHTLIKGFGITAKLLMDNGITVLNEDNYKEYFKGEMNE